MRLELVRAVSIVMRTLPYVVFRLAVWAGVWLLALVVLSMLGLISVMFGAAAFWAGLAALVVLCIGLGLGNWAKAYLLDVPRGCHIALLVEHAGEGLQPAGRVQPGWAKTRLLQRFGSLSSYQTCCELIGKAVRDIHQKVLGKNVPIPTRDSDRNPSVPPRFVALTLPRVIETMLAFVFVEDEGNVYRRAETALARYCRHGRRLLQIGLILTLLSWAATVALTLISAFILGFVALGVPASWEVARFILFLSAISLGAIAKVEVFDPIAATALFLSFMTVPESTGRETEWNARLAKASPAFCAIKRKAGTLR